MSWPHVIAHVDADCFYASCELSRRPDLIGRPVCVMSSQDACVVAKTYDAKARGITTGMPVWEAKRLLPEAIYLKADFRFYGQISRKMFSVFRRYSPDVEIYSIDEAFINLQDKHCLWYESYQDIANHLRQSIQEEVGITVSIGLSLSKTLAKIASESNKPNGTTLIDQQRLPPFLAQTPISAIPGIGRSRQNALQMCAIHTALQLSQASTSLIQSTLGKTGVDLCYELQGHMIHPLQTEPKLPKSMARTASLGGLSSDRALIRGQLLRHVFRLCMEMIAKGYRASSYTFFLRDEVSMMKKFQIKVSQAHADLNQVSYLAERALTRLYQPHKSYRSCGIIARDISSGDHVQAELFHPQPQKSCLALWESVNSINRRYGRDTLNLAAAQTKKHDPAMPRFCYPVYQARL